MVHLQKYCHRRSVLVYIVYSIILNRFYFQLRYYLVLNSPHILKKLPKLLSSATVCRSSRVGLSVMFTVIRKQTIILYYWKLAVNCILMYLCNFIYIFQLLLISTLVRYSSIRLNNRPKLREKMQQLLLCLSQASEILYLPSRVFFR